VKTAVKIGIAGAAFLLLSPCLLGLLAFAGSDATTVSALCQPAGSTATGPVALVAATSWDSQQVANAATIVTVGAQLGVPRAGWVIAVATAMQESSLRNLGNLGARNDHDSLGLFQQRPSQGWGTPEQILDPVHATTAFYQHLLKVPGWQTMPLTQAAQAVQRSAFPDAYARWQPEAEHLVDQIATQNGLVQNCGGPVAAGWVLPVPAGTYSLSSPFGPRWGTFHYGQDFAAPTGTPVYAAAPGTVLDAGCTSPRCDIPGSIDMPGCGLRITIDHGGGVATRYCHLSRLDVQAGQHVTAGQIIGAVGSTGNSTGPHLHFEVHTNAPPASNANAVDPIEYLRSVGLHP
jgi:murein DD-endopeptidase MepM/ murein hydrolase activator NlpD